MQNSRSFCSKCERAAHDVLVFGKVLNPAPRFLHRGALDFGGGADVRFWRFIALRGEIRDFFTGSPAYNALSITGGQHNVVAGGGFVLRFR